MSSKENFPNKPIDVVGIGNAIVDVLVKTEDSFLEAKSLKKGSMSLLSEGEAKQLYESIGPGLESSGGSAANTLAGIAQLGGNAGFIGRVRNDQLGAIFTHDISSTGALFNTPSAKKGPSTARCMIFVTPDAQRTMCTYLGASVLLEPEDLDLTMVDDSKVLYLEGYLWDNAAAKRAFIAAAKAAKDSDGKVALSLSDSFCVDRHRSSFLELIENHIDILFANKSEICSLHQTSDFEKAINKTKGLCEIAVLTCGEEGSIIITHQNKYKINPYNFGKVIDSTGAGDLYAGGFLYGYTNGEDLRVCGEIGSICAGKIVTQMGPRSQVELKDFVRAHLKKKT